MDSRTLAIKHIFGQERRLVVPLFQRPYVWNQAEQWEPLWADIAAVANRNIADPDGKQIIKPHFLGAVVLDAVQKPTGHLETRLIIDGQQRMTTMQLLLEAFADYCAEMNLERYHRALQKLTRNDDPMSNDEDEIFKVWPTGVDQEHFRRVMVAQTPTELKKTYNSLPTVGSVNQAIADCYLFFHSAITEWLKPVGPNFEKRVDVLYETLREKLRMVVIDLDDEDDAQVIFETLNARGTPLLPSDLVKNFLFYRARIEKQNIEQLYQKYWRPFDADDEYWRHQFGRGHTARARIDWFLQNYLSARKQDEVSTSHLYTTFRDFSLNNGSASQRLADLHRYAQVYRSFDNQAVGSREAVFFERMRTMDILSAYPCVLELFAAHGNQRGEVLRVLGDIESFLVRRMVCGLNTRGYNRLFVDVLKQIPGGENVSARLRAFFRTFTADSNRWPDDSEFLKAWLSKPIYDMLVPARVRMILEALEQQSHTGMTEPISFNTKLQVEHLMPQDWKEHWPLPPQADPKADPEIAKDRRIHLLHTMGNLTLLTEKLNPSVSNGPWIQKRKAILNHSALSLNRKLNEYADWNEDMIGQRARNLFEAATLVWPHPGKSSA